MKIPFHHSSSFISIMLLKVEHLSSNVIRLTDVARVEGARVVCARYGELAQKRLIAHVGHPRFERRIVDVAV